jgi:hypothetical protein
MSLEATDIRIHPATASSLSSFANGRETAVEAPLVHRAKPGNEESPRFDSLYYARYWEKVKMTFYFSCIRRRKPK